MVRLTSAEYAKLENEAVSAGMSVSELIRTRGIRGQKEIVAKPVFSKVDNEAIRLLSNIANNMNQQAAALNSGVKAEKIKESYAVANLIALQEIKDLLSGFFKNGRAEN